MNEAFERKQQCDWWNRAALGMLTLMVVLTIWLNACSSGSPGRAKTNKAVTPPTATSAATTEGSLPVSLSNAGEYGEDVYDYAKAKDWKNADVKIAALRDAVKKVATDVKNQKAVESSLLTSASWATP